MVSKLDYHFELSDADRLALASLPATVKRMDRMHFIVREGDCATHSCVLLEGTAVRSKYVNRGCRQICSIHIRGELVDLQNSLLTVADHCVEMITPGVVALIPREEIIAIAFERPQVGKALWMNSVIDAAIYLEWVANNGQRSARSRLAHLFCEFALRMEVAGLGCRSEYDLPMTQYDLADATGMTAVHVNRTIRSLEKEGLIERSSAKSIQIGDWHKLARVGDFNSRYLHLRPDDPAL